MEWYLIGIALFVLLFLFLAIGIPVAFSLGLSAILGILVFIGPQGVHQIGILVVQFGTRPDFLCVPLFVVMAEFLSVSGAANDLFGAVQKWFNKLPGGLAIGTTVACGVFGAACGTSTGGAATMGIVTIPELLKRGYSRSLTVGTVAAGGTLSILIPPSGIMILYAIITEQSIGRLFIAGFIPGGMMVAFFSIYILLHAWMRPGDAPSLPNVTWKERWDSLKPCWSIMIVIVGVFGTLYTGICTVTEAAAVGTFVALIIAIHRKVAWKELYRVGLRSTTVSCFIYFIVVGAMTFGYLLSYLNIPQSLSQAVIASGMPGYWFIIMIMALYLFLGCFLDPAGILVLTIPIFFPIIVKFGFDPIWFAILTTINMEAGNITPPVGLNLFVVKSISPPEVTLNDIVRGSIPFILLLCLGMAVIMIWPEIALWLPRTMLGR